MAASVSAAANRNLFREAAALLFEAAFSASACATAVPETSNMRCSRSGIAFSAGPKFVEPFTKGSR